MNDLYMTKTLLPLSILIILLGSVLATSLINPQKFKECKGSVIVAVAASMAVVFLGLNVVLNTANIDFQLEVTKNKVTKLNVDRLWVFPNQLLSEKTKARPEFYASLYYNNLRLYKLTENLHTKITIESELEEQYISILLFQCWEDYLNARKFDKTADAVWLVNYVQWAQSPYLKEHLDRLKYNYRDTTIRFAEFLFEYAHRLPVPTTDPESYKQLVQEMLKDPRLIEIYKEKF
ncbi:MAG: hypothetical protein Q8Q56_03380 [Alphaproteobacteria bacterium]|nr:hypothetical protein [Alphaproteobacteria bacterium]